MAGTTKDLARLCGVSRATVTRALYGTGSIKPETKERILEAAREIGYQPDLLARSLVRGSTMMIGVIVADLRNQYFPMIIDSIEKCSREEGYLLNISLHENSKDTEIQLVNMATGYRMEGLILNCVNKTEAFEKMLLKLELPYVILGYRSFAQSHTIGVDEYEAAAAAVTYILGKGYKRLIFVVPALYDDDGLENYGHGCRRRGFIDVAGQAGVSHEVLYGEENYLADALCIMKERSCHKPAFFCSGDTYAGALMYELSRHGYHAPQDYGIMGYDHIHFYQERSPRLATVDNHIQEMGFRAAQMLICMIRKEDVEKDIRIPATIIEGETL